MVRQANWRKVGGGSPPERRRNRSTFLREPDVSRNVIRCHDPHARGAYAMVPLGMRSVCPFPSRRDGRFPGFARRFRWRASGPSPDLSRERERSLSGGCPVPPKPCSSASRMPFVHPVSFHSVPSSPPPAPSCDGPFLRAYRLRVPAPARARFAAARFARLIAPVRPHARARRRAHPSRRLHRDFLAPARTEAASGSPLDPTHIGIDVPEGKP